MSWNDNASSAFDAALDEVKMSIGFLRAAMRARSTIGPLMSTELWQQVDQNARASIKEYHDQKSFTPGSSYRGLYISIAAAFERFVRGIIIEAVQQMATRAKTFNELPENLKKKNVHWSGKVLAQVFDPPEEFAGSMEQVCSNLGTCVAGNAKFQLNAASFGIDLPTLSADGLENALGESTWTNSGTSLVLPRD